jgi:hypothetical protein
MIKAPEGINMSRDGIGKLFTKRLSSDILVDLIGRIEASFEYGLEDF